MMATRPSPAGVRRGIWLAAVLLATNGLTVPALAKGPVNQNWAGPYAGIQFGYGFSMDNDVTTTGQAPGNITNVNGGARPASVSLDTKGILGGLQAGYNWQQGAMVFGLEADIAYADGEESETVTTTALNGVDQLNNDFEQTLEYFGTVRGRIGYAALDRLLLFGTAGLAYGGVDNSADFFGPAGQRQFSGSDSGVEFGYAGGAGMEYALTDRWSFKAEYLYYDLGDSTVDVAVIPGSGGGGTGYDSEFENDGHIVRTALSYRF